MTSGGGPACCPLPPGVPPLPAVAEGAGEEVVARVVAVAKALADPVRVRMLGLMALGQDCCRPAAPQGASPEGVCVCEFQARYGLAQSKVSYHLKVLREAGLVREQRRGKWSFYAVDQQVLRSFADDVLAHVHGG